MNAIAFRQQFKVDATQTIHVVILPEMSHEVGFLFSSRHREGKTLESSAMASLFDESGVAKHVINCAEDVECPVQ